MGRPPVSAETAARIERLATESNGWGYKKDPRPRRRGTVLLVAGHPRAGQRDREHHDDVVPKVVTVRLSHRGRPAGQLI